MKEREVIQGHNEAQGVFSHPLFRRELETVEDTPENRTIISKTPLDFLVYLRLGESAQDPYYDPHHQQDFRLAQEKVIEEMSPETLESLGMYIDWRIKNKI